ncbi:MAG: hypothetical protein ACLUTA_14545 [Blautia wexlerae]
MSICTDGYQADPRLILGFHVVPGQWLLQERNDRRRWSDALV